MVAVSFSVVAFHVHVMVVPLVAVHPAVGRFALVVNDVINPVPPPVMLSCMTYVMAPGAPFS